MFFTKVAPDPEIVVTFDDIPEDAILRVWITKELINYVLHKNGHIITMCAEHYLQRHVDGDYDYRIVINNSDTVQVVVSEQQLVL